MNHPHLAGIFIGALALGAATTLVVQHVRAAGAPTKGVLTYTGYLEDANGTPVTNEQRIGLALYDNSTAGNKVCEVDAKPKTPVGGWFEIQFQDKCVDAVSANSELWVEVSVAAVPLGRTKLGAVPYAVEAGHSKSADSATSANTATTAADAKGLHVTSDGNAQAFISTNNSASNNFSYLFLDKGRGTGQAPESVVKGDEISRIYGRAFNAGSIRNATIIESIVDAAPGSAYVPGALLFGTSDGTQEAKERMRVNSSGNVSIGCGNAGQKLTICTNAVESIDGLFVVAGDSRNIRLSPSLGPGSFNGMVQKGDGAIVYSGGSMGTGAFAIVPWADGTSGIRMTSNGKVGIGKANPDYLLDVEGEVRVKNVSVTSDERLKANIKTIEHPLEDLSKLRGVRFNWKSSGSKSIGVVAQDVERVYPELVSTATDGTKSVDYDKLIAVVIESSKTLASQNSDLRRDNEALQERLDRLERKLDHLLSSRGDAEKALPRRL